MEAGSQLGNYVIKDRLGRGATAEVFRALQSTIDRDVAIKVMFPHLNDTPDFAIRFQREARAMGGLQHPNIGRVIDFDASGERPYMVMEHLDGGSLQELMNATQGPLPVPQALQITRQITDALRYAHSMGMIHRDIKPANVMFTDDTHECAMVMDFGMARLVDENMTATGAILGTPAFMAPEQMRGEVVGAQADLYSVGVMLYEMVTGQPLYQADSLHTLMMKHVDAPIPSARAASPQISAELDAFLQKAVAKQPADRFSDAAEMVHEIDMLLGPAPVQVSSGSRNTVMQGGTAAPAGAARPGAKGSGRSPMVLVAAIAAVALIAVGTAFLLTRGGDSPDQEVVDSAPATADDAPSNEAEPSEAEPAAAAPNEAEPDQAEPNQADEPPAAAEEPDDQPQPAAAAADRGAQARAAFDPTNPPRLFVTSAQMEGDEFVLAWDRTRPSPAFSDAATEYRASIDTLAEPLGVLAVDGDGRGTLRTTAPAHLASSFQIAIVDPATGETADVVYENTMTQADREAFDRRETIVAQVERELAIAVDHRGLIEDELANGNLPEARRHAEHVINIIDGSLGPLFGDLDGSGLAENPGDGTGVLAYAQSWIDDGAGPDDSRDSDQQMVLRAGASLVATQNSGVQLLSSDSVEEANRTFETLSQSMASASTEFDLAKALLRTRAVNDLVGDTLALTGTDSSTGTMAVLRSGQRVVSSSAEGDAVEVDTTAGAVPIPATGFAVIDASPPADLQQAGVVTLRDVSGAPVGSGVLDEASLAVFQQLTADGGVLALLEGQGQIVADHADLMRSEIEANNHSEVRRHAEHVVNIIVGELGETFGDLDGDGAAQNPGDGVGALVYLDQVGGLLDQLPTDTIEQRFYVQAYRTSLASIRQDLETTQSESLRVLSTDSAAEAQQPTDTAVTASVDALVGRDADTSGAIDIDEAGIRVLAEQGTSLLSVPIEP